MKTAIRFVFYCHSEMVTGAHKTSNVAYGKAVFDRIRTTLQGHVNHLWNHKQPEYKEI